MESVEKPFIFMPEYLADFNKKVKEMSNFTDDQIKKLLSNAKAAPKSED